MSPIVITRATPTEVSPEVSPDEDRERKLMAVWSSLDRTANRLTFKREMLVSLTSDSKRYRGQLDKWEVLAADYRTSLAAKDRDSAWSSPVQRAAWQKQIIGLEGDIRVERDRVRKYDAIIDVYLDAIAELERNMRDLQEEEKGLKSHAEKGQLGGTRARGSDRAR